LLLVGSRLKKTKEKKTRATKINRKMFVLNGSFFSSWARWTTRRSRLSDRRRNISRTGEAELHDVGKLAARVGDGEVVAAHQPFQGIALLTMMETFFVFVTDADAN